MQVRRSPTTRVGVNFTFLVATSAILSLLLCICSTTDAIPTPSPITNRSSTTGTTGSEIHNVALNKRYKVEATIPDLASETLEKHFSDPRGTKLTDGLLSPTPDAESGFWVGWLEQDERLVVIDLGQICTLKHIAAHTMQSGSMGIFFPDTVGFDLSANNKTWGLLETVKAPYPPYHEEDNFGWYNVTGLNIAGRYLRLRVPTNIWVFVDEVMVFGEEGIVDGAKIVKGVPDHNITDKGYPKPGPNAPFNHQILIYAGYWPTDPRVGQWTTKDFLPYLRYVDRDGRPQGPMFDSFLFLPIGGKAPSGTTYDDAGRSNKTDWQYLIDDYLNLPHLQINALNDLASLFKQRVSVWIAIPYPSPALSYWGELDGERLSFGPGVDQQTALKNRVKAIQWYIHGMVAKFNEARYEYLTLGGFYWLSETIPIRNGPNEVNVVKQTADVIHALPPNRKGAKLQLEWIPFFSSVGYKWTAQMNIDLAIMQPNYMFDKYATPQRIQATTEIAKRYGLGIEMEYADWETNNVAKYNGYLKGGLTYGYMNESILAWYQDTKDFAELAYSPNEADRKIYEDTYFFINKTYTN